MIEVGCEGGEVKGRENIVRAILRSFVFVNFGRIFYVLQHIMERRKRGEGVSGRGGGRRKIGRGRL